MIKRTENWVYIIKPDGEQRIASPDFIKELLGIERLDVQNVYNRIQKLEQKIDVLEEPIKKQKILKILENGETHNRIWIENRVPDMGGYNTIRLINELVEEGKLQVSKAGAQDMFSIKKEASG